jgi:hypothetical protein
LTYINPRIAEEIKFSQKAVIRDLFPRKCWSRWVECGGLFVVP